MNQLIIIILDFQIFIFLSIFMENNVDTSSLHVKNIFPH